jgi:hypothetical protein
MDFINFLKGIFQLFLDFIGYIFDIDFRDDENPFPDADGTDLSDKKPTENVERITPKASKLLANREIDRLQGAFGREAASYIVEMRNDADEVINKHELQYTDSILTVLSPERLGKTEVSPSVISGMIESIYAQFDGDVILRPGKINVFVTQEGSKFAEMYIDCYKPSEVLISS